jgi:hypothetical protein
MKAVHKLVSLIVIGGAISLSANSCRRAVPQPTFSQTTIVTLAATPTIVTLTATPTFTVPPNPYPILPYPIPGDTDVSQIMISQTPIPTELPLDVIVVERLGCTTEVDYVKCDDSILGVEFEYPAIWGDIERTLKRGDTGLAYSYRISKPAPEQKHFIEAGGISRDFTEGRGGKLTDFSGFGDKTGCEYYYWGSICEEISKNVIIVLIFPNADTICDPGPTVLYSPIALIAIDLPENPIINGFIFVSPFLSEKQDQELHSLLGITPEGDITKCHQESKQQFNSKVSELVEAIKDDTVDVVTKSNLDQMYRLAKSIKLK